MMTTKRLLTLHEFSEFLILADFLGAFRKFLETLIALWKAKK